MRIQESNPDLTHQMVLRIRQYQLIVSCNCRRVLGKHDRTRKNSDYYEAMNRDSGESVYQVYNNPDNHSAEFTKKDMIRCR